MSAICPHKAEARRAGLKKYFNGKPCVRGHVAERDAQSGGCTVCTSARAIAFKHAYPEKYKAAKKRYTTANREKCNTDIRRYRRSPAGRAAKNAMERARQAAALHRTPVRADLKQIGAHYKIATKLTRAMGRQYEVDHVIPLQGKRISGLHVQNNLQVILGVDNARKGNRFEENYGG